MGTLQGLWHKAGVGANVSIIIFMKGKLSSDNYHAATAKTFTHNSR
jgi:hypothetical protein